MRFDNIITNSAETVFLLKADSDSATNAAITYQNSSGVSTDFARNSSPEASTFSPYRSGGYSTNFDGSGDAIEVSQTGFPAIGTSNFTIETWVYANSLSSNMSIIDCRPSGTSGGVYIVLEWHTTNGLGLYVNGSWRITNSPSPLTVNTWHHVALCRSGSSTRIFVDGTQVGSTYSDSNNYLYGRNYIGGLYNNTNTWWNGYMRDFRVSIGTARYTTTFTPPTETLTADANTDVLVCHLPYIKDGSTNDAALTLSGNVSTTPFGPYDYEPWTADLVGGSTYFDGTDDGLTTTSTAIGTGEFTVEAWIYLHSTDTETIFDTRADGNNTGIEFRVHNGVLRLIVGATGTVCTGTTTLLANTWYHVAATRNSSNVCKVYLNGKTDGSSSTATDNLTNTSVTIGRQHASTQFFDGYIADLRFRTESYTANYTPPTSPLSNTASTQLLMNNKSDANVYDAAAASSLTLTGAVSSTTQRKFTTSSAIYFDGTDDYIRSQTKVIGGTTTDPILETFTSTASPFTIEGWVYWHKTPASHTFVIGINPMSSNANTVLIGQNANAWKLFINGTEQTPTGTITDNTWYHFALTFDATNVKFYVDGTQTYSAAETSIGPLNSQVFLLGTEADSANGGSLGNWAGVYVQDIRISHGVRYTTSFTPPTAEFEL